MDFIDTHCHIQSAGLSEGERHTRELWAKAPELTPEQIIANANESGVTKLLIVGCDLKDSQLAVEFAAQRENCWSSIGIHPHEAKLYADNPNDQKTFALLAKRPKVVAVGECGYDFYYNHSPKADQTKILRFQIELALEHALPLIFHVREAFDDFWPVFDSYTGVRGVLHSFTDDWDNMRRALDRGLCIGVNGIATFTKKPEQLAVFRELPLENLLLETDAPFLTPTPYRGSINQPKHVRRVAEFLSELRGESLQEIADSSSANAAKLFGI